MKTLIIYAKAGAGHKRAAEAVYEAFRRRGQKDEVKLIDCLDYTTSWFKTLYPQTYIFLVRFLSPVWAAIYYALENRVLYNLIKPLRRLTNYFTTKKLIEFIKKEKPKVIVSTQFFASEVVADLKRKKEIKSTLITVVTDFGAHTFWESEYVDIFVVASKDTKQDLLRRGIPERKIRVLGIPIDPPARDFDQDAWRKEIDLREDSFSILLVGGGFGVGPIKELVSNLGTLGKDVKNKVQLIVVCSRNKALYSEMEKLVPTLDIDVKLFGFVTELYKMMLVSKIIISKPGGLTTSESLACGLPMIIIAPIPGQESKNCALLVKNGAAIRINKAMEAKEIVEELVKDPEKLDKMRNEAFTLARPDSADDIVVLVNTFYH